VVSVNGSNKAMMLGILLLGCAQTAPTKVNPPQTQSNGEANRVAVVVNATNTDSVRIGQYYATKRKVPAQNIIRITTTHNEEITPEAYALEIEAPVRKALSKLPGIDFIVLTKGTPIRIGDQGGYSVDGALAAMNLKTRQIKQKVGQFLPDETDMNMAVKEARNPFFASTERFSSKKFGGMYLVTRLIGYTVQDCLKLVDNSLNAKPSKGPFLLDSQPAYGPGTGYYPMEQQMLRANQALPLKGMDIYYEQTDTFSDGREPLMGYISWGSNDKSFDIEAYHRVKFKPGAIAETYVSTSARTFGSVRSGQSLIGDLVQQGVTGAKGYVSEPFTFALCPGELLFGRYYGGFNLAEAFYAASPVVKWKDMVIGDPLCRPFKTGKL